MNTNTTIKKRIFTMAMRGNTAILTDSANPQSTISFKGENLSIIGLQLLNKVLESMPAQKLNYKVAILLPHTIVIPTFENTRNAWIANGKTKSGNDIDPVKLHEVIKLNELLRAKGHNVEIFDQSKLTSVMYKSFTTKTWQLMDKIVPKTEATDCNAFVIQ